MCIRDRPLTLRTLKPSNPQNCEPATPRPFDPSNLRTFEPSNLRTLKPSNPQTFEGAQNHQAVNQYTCRPVRRLRSSKPGQPLAHLVQ
eukprot:5085911-Alexandrium_andersonii.AAC.1